MMRIANMRIIYSEHSDTFVGSGYKHSKKFLKSSLVKIIFSYSVAFNYGMYFL
jgi:hypothetical protein